VVATSDPETAIACLDTAISKFGLNQKRLERVFRHEPQRSRGLVLKARPGSDSGLESIVRQRLTLSGVSFRQQVFFAGIGRVDFVVDDSVVVEIDGWAFHTSVEAFEKDRRRDALLTERGLTVLRFSFRQVMEDWIFVERVIRSIAQREGVASRSGRLS
jgi:very-short-patch-repair endonuclease